MPESIAVLGGKGMLGSDTVEYLRQEDYSVNAYDLPECDITRHSDLERVVKGIDVVINCAAFTNVDGAETHRDRAKAVNAIAVGALGEIAKKQGIFVLHISTDFVFDGKSEKPYSEANIPAPINTYGRTKLNGEELLIASGCQCGIMRVQWSYGKNGKNFITKLIASAQAGNKIKVVNDQVGAPTWTVDIAQAISCLIRGRCEGIYHFANKGYVSRFEVALFIAEQMQLKNSVAPCSSEEFSTKALRPKNSRFDTSKIQAVLNYPIRPWQTALLNFLEQETPLKKY